MPTAFGLPQLLSLYDPNVANEQAQIDRQTALANALRQESLTPIQTNGQIGGMGYRVSPLNIIAKALQGYQANQIYNQTDQQRLAMMAALAGAVRGNQPGQPGAPVIDNGSGPAGGSVPASEANVGGSPTSQPTGTGIGFPEMIHGAMLESFSPALAVAYAKGLTPTDISREVAAAGIDPNSTLGHQIIQQHLAKGNYIPPTSVRPGGFLQEPSGRITNVPQTQPGFVSVQDPTSPTGFRTVEQPGGLSSIGAAEGAKVGAAAAAEAPYQFENVTTGSGATVPVSRAQLAAGALRNFGKPPVQPETGNQPPAANANDPWASIPKLPVPGGIGQTTFNKEISEEQAKLAGELAKKYGESANAANGRIALNNQALGLVDNSDTGPGAARIADVKNLLTSYFPNAFPESDFANTPSATISLQKDLLNAAVQRAKQQFGSRITQQEVMLMLSRGAPNVDMPKAAIKYLITSDNAMNQYTIQQANDFGKYTQLGGDPMRFEGWYSQHFPANNAVAEVHLNTGKPQEHRQAPQKTVVKSGTYQGRRVNMYSDGSIDYAN